LFCEFGSFGTLAIAECQTQISEHLMSFAVSAVLQFQNVKNESFDYFENLAFRNSSREKRTGFQ
jgi:hypothetical protein